MNKQREIKFRAWVWDKNNKDLVPKMIYQIGEMANGLPILKDFEQYSGLELMQYTGLKDKNGKEIYEGDIISDGVSKSLIAKNLFHNNFGIVDLPLQEQCREFDVEYLKKCGVIGNIYENPNLLK